MDSNWLNNNQFDYFWKCYSNAHNFSLNKNNIYNEYVEKFNRIKQASILAHTASLNTIQQVDSVNQGSDKILTNENDIEFEINQNVLNFYRKSRKFKREKQQEEKKRLKAINEGTYTDYTSGEQVKMEVDQPSKDAPLDRVGFKREEELKILYGTRANVIHLAETKLQMKYDRNLDTYQPKYWPSFPLKIKFD